MHDRDHGPGIFPLGNQTFPHTLHTKTCVFEKKIFFDHWARPKSIWAHLVSFARLGGLKPGYVVEIFFLQKNTQNMSQDP